MASRKLTLQVPNNFADMQRERELSYLSRLTLVMFGAAWLLDSGATERFSNCFAIVGFFLVACILIILVYSKMPLIYNITPKGVSITVQERFAAILLAIAMRFRFMWPNDAIVTVEHRYFGDHSVVLLRQKESDTVYCLPVAPSDVPLVADFLLTHNKTNIEQDEQTPTSIK
jgi:hypothetical protein